MERGLYGQSESDAAVIAAADQRDLDMKAEGEFLQNGSRTELGFRLAMAREARKELDAERDARRSKAGTKGLELRAAIERQRGALQNIADLADEMKDEGFAQGNVFAAISCSRPGAYELRKAGGGEIAKEDPGFLEIRPKGRAPRMYNPERDSLTTPDGKGKLLTNGERIEI